jgi:cystathionine beta-lyase/cystathionine gamma-synthase
MTLISPTTNRKTNTRVASTVNIVHMIYLPGHRTNRQQSIAGKVCATMSGLVSVEINVHASGNNEAT